MRHYIFIHLSRMTLFHKTSGLNLDWEIKYNFIIIYLSFQYILLISYNRLFVRLVHLGLYKDMLVQNGTTQISTDGSLLQQL